MNAMGQMSVVISAPSSADELLTVGCAKPTANRMTISALAPNNA